MNEDYLWDKSGEPDPDVQQLEEILGTLRYKPRPFVIPRELVIVRRRSYFPLLAIAATIALALLAAGLWLRLQNQKTDESAGTKKSTGVPAGIREDVPTPQVAHDVTVVRAPNDKSVNNSIHHRYSRNLLATNPRRLKNPRDTGLKPNERQEALAAKAQLMTALRLASEKLNLAQRRTQLSTPANLIRNQHKVG